METINQKKTRLASDFLELSESECLIQEIITFLKKSLESSKLSPEVRERYKRIIKNSIQSLLCLRVEIGCKKAELEKLDQRIETKIIS